MLESYEKRQKKLKSEIKLGRAAVTHTKFGVYESSYSKGNRYESIETDN